MAETNDRTPLIIAMGGGALAAVVAVGGIWFALRATGDDEITAGDTAATSTVDGSATTVDGEGSDGDADASSTSVRPTEDTTNGTTIDDVPLSDLPNGAPGTFVAVTADTFELVRVDADSGEVLAELGSWGPGGDGEIPEQALQTVELAPDGTIYVDDCCEPAYGSTFIVTDGFDPATTPRLSGLGPEVSPDGSLLARSDFGSAVVISDLAGNSLGSFGDPDFTGTITTPLTWIDDSTLVVNEYDSSDDRNRLQILDVSNPDEPSLIAERDEPGRLYAAADVRADGDFLVVTRHFDPAVGSTEADDVIAEVIDSTTGQIIVDFDLPDDVYEANYDASGRFVVTARSNGQLDWYGGGQRGTLGTGFISADW